MKKLLLFEFDDLRDILAAAGAMKPFGAEVVTVSRSSYGLTLEALARGETIQSAGHAALGGRLLVFCGMDTELDGALSALRNVGITGMKAVLTPSNRAWTPERLYRELERERRSMGG